MARTWKEWTTAELRLLDQHYTAGTPVVEIAELVDHTAEACIVRARERGLHHPGHSSAQAIRNFEEDHGRSLHEIACEYRDRRLSRITLAHDIGIERLALKNALSDELWKSWPRMTIGRIDAAKRRRKAA